MVRLHACPTCCCRDKVIADCLASVHVGALRVVIDRKFPLSQAAAPHAYIESRAAFGRVVTLPNGCP